MPSYLDEEAPDAEHRPDEDLLQAVSVEASLGENASIEAVYQLTNDGEDVNQRSVAGYTPLAIAAAAGHAPLVAVLLEQRADVAPATVHRGELPLHHAARAGHRVVCQLLAPLARAATSIDAPNVTGWSALQLAVAAGHTDVISVMLQNGAMVNGKNAVLGGCAPLHVAARLGHLEAAEALLDREADANVSDALGGRPLHVAATRCDARCVSLLLRSRAATSCQRSDTGITPMELVPAGHADRARVANLLAAYARPPPEPLRSDARFDIPDERDL